MPSKVGRIYKGSTKKNIYIAADRQAAIKARDKYQINYKFVWQSLMKVAERNRVQLKQVAGHRGLRK